MNGPREIRIHTSLLAAVEKRCLVWMAHRMPAAINSDHLTALGGRRRCSAAGAVLLDRAAATRGALGRGGDARASTGSGTAWTARWRACATRSVPATASTWTMSLDAVGLLFLIGGLVLGGFMSPGIGAAFLVAYYLLTNEIALATHAVGTFRISYLEVRADGAADPARRRDDRSCCDRRTVTVFGPARCCCSTSAARLRLPACWRPSWRRRLRTRATLYRAEPLPMRPAPAG